MRRTPRSPLPQRHGLDAARLTLPAEGPWTTLRDHLVDRLPRVPPERIDAMLREKRIVGRDGPLAPDAPFVPRARIWFHRDLPAEVPVPFEITVVHRDDALLVVDKPHFLATIPRGRHVVETALVRLRRDLDLPELSPAHRLDRTTAGLLMFVVRRELRGAYQTLFRDRLVRKTYEAVAPYAAGLPLPCTVRSRIVKERGVIAAREVPGPPNAETSIELLARRGGLGRYRLHPANRAHPPAAAAHARTRRPHPRRRHLPRAHRDRARRLRPAAAAARDPPGVHRPRSPGDHAGSPPGPTCRRGRPSRTGHQAAPLQRHKVRWAHLMPHEWRNSPQASYAGG